jgi:starch phosphorylase
VFDPPVHVAVWKVAVGRISLYLLDTDLDANQPWDRDIAQHLYASNPEQRLRQEIVLGIGGMQALAALGIQPGGIHINEGHPALALLDRLARFRQAGESWQTSLDRVQETAIFTTHTPLPAGTDVFRFDLLEKYLGPYLADAGIERSAFLQLGVNPGDPNAGFNMTVFALRASRFRNAVSQRHGQVARQLWSGLWPERNEADVPIASITNGVHLASWIDASGLQPLLDRYLGPSWLTDQDRAGIWELVDSIPDDELWAQHQRAKATLIGLIAERARARWRQDRIAPNLVLALGVLLDPEVLTIGFARRFTAYKRPDLLLTDLDRLTRLLTNPLQPVQVVFAGDAHPSDVEGKRLIQHVVHLAQDPTFGGRIAFVEDYDRDVAAALVQGVDVWLNTPLPPLEASGTSGMKAGINGVPQLSVLDGWWCEGYAEGSGWAFGGEPRSGDQRATDAEALYRLLENTIVPLFYARSNDGIPHDFVKVMKAAIARVAPGFGTQRMVKEYTTKFYAPALGLQPRR